jgi:Protein of unknown function (DUF2867)
MSVVECDVPRHSALGKALIERADFRHAYCAPLSRSDLDVVDIFFGIFGQRPSWMNLMLIARNKVAGLAGLEVPTCRRKVEMSPVAQSRNDTPIGDGHDEHDLDCIPAVKVEQRI